MMLLSALSFFEVHIHMDSGFAGLLSHIMPMVKACNDKTMACNIFGQKGGGCMTLAPIFAPQIMAGEAQYLWFSDVLGYQEVG